MKSFLLIASAASLVRASGLLDVYADLAGDDSVDLGAGLNIRLPEGIALTDDQPIDPPTYDRINVWHPSHPGVVMDGCDDDHTDEWHYVHPCNCENATPYAWTTSVVPPKETQSVVSCDSTRDDCPSGHTTVNVVVPATTTICPVAVTAAPSAAALEAPVAAATEEALPSASLAAAPQTMATSVVPAAQPSGYPAPMYSIPSNQTAPMYTAPAPQGTGAPAYAPPPAPSAGCIGSGCSPFSHPAPPALPAGTGMPSGAGPMPTMPTVAGASKQSVGALLIAGLAAAFFL